MDMRLAVRRTWLVLLLAVLCATAISAQAERWLVDGAIVSSRGPTPAKAALRNGLSGIPLNFSATHLGSSVALLTERRSHRAPFSIKNSKLPIVYTRKTNPCKRAKFRRVIKKLVGARCEPNYAQFLSVTPNDPLYSPTYVNTQLSLEAAWNYSTGSDSLLAVVIDTGVLYSHPDLQENMWVNPNEIAGNGIDDDNNGVIDDIHGVNAVTWAGPQALSNAGDPLDDHGHGTHCAGTLGARGNNARGVVGVNWNIKIVAAKFIESSGIGSTSNAIKAIKYATLLRRSGHKVVVTTNSWGGGSYSQALLDAINEGAAHGILFIAAAGNDSEDNDLYTFYPASYDSDAVISVASSNQSGNLSDFSNYGATSVDIAAPGSSILSTWLSNQYATTSGTSMATPQVAGIVALAQSMCIGPTLLTLQESRSVVLTTGTTKTSLNGRVATSAIANAHEAVKAAVALCGSGVATAIPTTTPTATTTTTPTSTPTATETPVVTPTVTPSSQPTAGTPPANANPTDPQPSHPRLTPAPGSEPIDQPSEPDTGDHEGSIEVSPKDELQATKTITLRVVMPPSQKRFSLRISGSDGRGNYVCPTLVITPGSRSFTRTITLPRAPHRLRSLQIATIMKGKPKRHSLTFANPVPTAHKRRSIAYMRSLCSATKSGLED